jgi:hypothetical protein
MTAIMKPRRLLCLMMLGPFGGLSGCMGGIKGGVLGPPPPAATPVVSSISPTSATAGGLAFTLTVNGSNFISGADVVWTNPGNPGFVGGPRRLSVPRK